MTTADTRPLANLAERLGDDEMHVWQLDYRRDLRREPLRRVLAAYLATTPADVRLVSDPHGRPRLHAAHGSTLDFNWTHSGDRALIALAHGAAPGVDVERVRPRPNALEIARRFFSADEVAALEALPEPLRGQAFLDVWTAKEALLKAHGRGLAFGLDRLSVARDGAALQLRRFDGHDVRAWQLHRLSLGPALVGALAWQGGPRRIRLGMLASVD